MTFQIVPMTLKDACAYVRWTENGSVLYDIIRAIADQYRKPTEEKP